MKNTHIPLLLLQEGLKCQYRRCGSILKDPCRHSTCRRHSECAIPYDNSFVWYPEFCNPCFPMMEYIQNPLPEENDPAVRSEYIEILKTWVRGYGKNRKGKPSLLDESHKQLLFPGSSSSKYIYFSFSFLIKIKALNKNFLF